MHSNLSDDYYEPAAYSSFQSSTYAIVFIVVIDICILAIGLVGNIVTCIVIVSGRSMHTPTNCYLFNLAISDLLLLITGVTYDIYMAWNPYQYYFSNVTCYCRSLASETSINVSVLTITAFTVERYLAICRPLVVAQVMYQLSRVLKLILAIWMAGFLWALTITWQAYSFQGVSTCAYNYSWLTYGLEMTTLLFFVLPMAVITILYVLIAMRLIESSRMDKSRGRWDGAENEEKQRMGSIDASTRRVLKMLRVVVAIFFMCWLPFHAHRMMSIYGETLFNNVSFEDYQKIDDFMFYFSGVFHFFSTAVNPIIYSIMSNKFREAFKESLSKCRKISRAFPHRKNTLARQIIQLKPT